MSVCRKLLYVFNLRFGVSYSFFQQTNLKLYTCLPWEKVKMGFMYEKDGYCFGAR